MVLKKMHVLRAGEKEGSRMKINIPERIEMPGPVEGILRELRTHGYEAFAVGGCVRDVLLGREPGDWDITTSARPEQVKAVFGKTVDTGLQHGTVTVIRNRVGYEITTYRIDGEYEDGRHPKEVIFTADLREDLRRRDFTINAMAYSHETGLVDAFGGLEDLKAGRIRCVGNAVERFTEDALRMLRAVRFSAQLGFSIEEKTWEALQELAPNLAMVSKERILTELTKTLLSDRPENVCLIESAGLIPYISKTFRAVLGEELEERLKKSGALPASRGVRFAALLLNAGEENAGRILRELKSDRETMDKTRLLVRWFSREIGQAPADIRRVMSAMEDTLFDDLLTLRETLRPEEARKMQEIRKTAAGIRERGECIRLRQLAITGADLIACGLQPGPELGKTLNRLFEGVLEHPEWNQKETLLKQVFL